MKIIKKKLYKNHHDLISDLKNNNYIFIKDYYEQKLDEKNISYILWIKKLYSNIFSFNNNKKRLNINTKIEIPNYSEIIEKLRNNLYYCENPKCKSIIYMNSQQRIKLEKILNLNFVEYFFEDKDITGYEK